MPWTHPDDPGLDDASPAPLQVPCAACGEHMPTYTQWNPYCGRCQAMPYEYRLLSAHLFRIATALERFIGVTQEAPR